MLLRARLFLQESSMHIKPLQNFKFNPIKFLSVAIGSVIMLLKAPSAFQSRLSCKNIDTDIDRHTRDVWSSEYSVFHSDFEKVCPGLILVMKLTCLILGIDSGKLIDTGSAHRS